jgi:hypothetical protein
LAGKFFRQVSDPQQGWGSDTWEVSRNSKLFLKKPCVFSSAEKENTSPKAEKAGKFFRLFYC